VNAGGSQWGSCSDDVDNDCGGLTDSADPDCPCTAIGNSCSSNSECCDADGDGTKICEPATTGTTNEECINDCPSGFSFNSGSGECEPDQELCYDEKVGGEECTSWGPFSSAWKSDSGCLDATETQACCQWKTYDGDDYGKYEGASSY